FNPNARINAEGRAPFDLKELKVLGSYRLPVADGFVVSGVLWRQNGNTWERSFTYFNTLIPFDFQTIRLEQRGSRRTEAVWNLDLRIEKTFRRTVRRGTLGAALDVFNATNQGTPRSIFPASGPSFGRPFSRSDPRMARLVLRYTF
ncbi:MAG: hypothetical protein HY654_14230, partial [Acidobacteria bacterium]|nr:hypothetical protein [Acidobacteriota bacterium]